MTRIGSLAAAIGLFLLGFASSFARERPPAKPLAPAPCPPDALGTARVLAIGPKSNAKDASKSGLTLGLKTYPQTLDLADHEVVLTFDDGPWPGTTPAILTALAQQCVKATFFLIGRNAEAAPDLVQRELAEGHTLGHHSFSHPAATLRGLSDAAARRDIERGFSADDIAAYGHAEAEPKVPFFRFPGFADTPELDTWLTNRKIILFGADLWASDWLRMTPKAELDLVLNRLEAEKGGILLMHDIHRTTAAMLPDLLVELKRRGFKIVHLVPGTDPPPLRNAPAGWTSETEAIIRQVRPDLPKLALPDKAPEKGEIRDFTQTGVPEETVPPPGIPQAAPKEE
jgi:peptidoglycan/xylan/chitin deacetylase (PgdA/CDA1 family)